MEELLHISFLLSSCFSHLFPSQNDSIVLFSYFLVETFIGLLHHSSIPNIVLPSWIFISLTLLFSIVFFSIPPPPPELSHPFFLCSAFPLLLCITSLLIVCLSTSPFRLSCPNISCFSSFILGHSSVFLIFLFPS